EVVEEHDGLGEKRLEEGRLRVFEVADQRDVGVRIEAIPGELSVFWRVRQEKKLEDQREPEDGGPAVAPAEVRPQVAGEGRLRGETRGRVGGLRGSNHSELSMFEVRAHRARGRNRCARPRSFELSQSCATLTTARGLTLRAGRGRGIS